MEEMTTATKSTISVETTTAYILQSTINSIILLKSPFNADQCIKYAINAY